jgi:membrane-bound metal-dependent hydrolase YbcI (DUF457 family)
MQGPSHLLVSWYFADAAGVAKARDRRIVAWAGLAPDIDVLAYAGALLYYRLDKDLAFENVWRVVHHRYTHGFVFVALTGMVAWMLASDREARTRVALFAMAASVLHVFCDLVAGGPTWPVYPLWPASGLGWSASWSWTIGEWPNIAILFVCLAAMFAYAKFAARSPLECFGDRADAWFVRIATQAPRPAGTQGNSLRWIIWACLILGAIAILAPLGFKPGG